MYINWEEVQEKISNLSPEDRLVVEDRIQRFIDEAEAASKLFSDIGQTAYVTKTGRVLTDADIEAYADEAEHGYDLDR